MKLIRLGKNQWQIELFAGISLLKLHMPGRPVYFILDRWGKNGYEWGIVFGGKEIIRRIDNL